MSDAVFSLVVSFSFSIYILFQCIYYTPNLPTPRPALASNESDRNRLKFLGGHAQDQYNYPMRCLGEVMRFNDLIW